MRVEISIVIKGEQNLIQLKVTKRKSKILAQRFFYYYFSLIYHYIKITVVCLCLMEGHCMEANRPPLKMFFFSANLQLDTTSESPSEYSKQRH